ncbi:GH24 family phage-related lysozyme (muramidase) [Nitrobacteraceae bacterium AZCC 2161]
MLYRMVRPVQRKGSRNRQFHQRIPTELRSKAAGLRLDIPLGESTISLRLSANTETVRLSLRTADPDEVKQRQAGVAAYLTSVWTALRKDGPVSLNHRQATALAGELFRAWTKDGATQSLAIEQAPEGGWRHVQNETDADREAEWSAVNAYWEAMGATGRSEDGFAFVTPSPSAQAVRFSLRTSDPTETKTRQAIAAAFLEGVWAALRNDVPTKLSHKQATALAGQLYRVWADSESNARSIAMQHTPGVGWVRVDETSDEQEEHWETPQDVCAQTVRELLSTCRIWVVTLIGWKTL